MFVAVVAAISVTDVLLGFAIPFSALTPNIKREKKKRNKQTQTNKKKQKENGETVNDSILYLYIFKLNQSARSRCSS